MNTNDIRSILLVLVTLILIPVSALCGNIDPDDNGSQFAYGENIGWTNFEPSFGPGVTVTDSAITGCAWAENVGWIRMDSVFGGVINDGLGNLSGYAWGENVGWISFSCENTGTCDSVAYGVSIDPITGEFSGNAWGENIGWITFRSMGAVDYGVTTSWVASVNDCEGDFDGDHDVDGSDLAVFAADFGRTDCASPPPCEGDFDGDGDVDGSDLAVFAADFGRTDCPY